MAIIKKFEELEIWQLARVYCKEVYGVTKYKAFSKDFGLVDQIKRSSGSIMDNIAEGFGRGGNREFVNFLTFSIGSGNESQSQLYRALDQEYISQMEFDGLYKQSEEIILKTGKLIQYLKNSNYKGIKFK